MFIWNNQLHSFENLHLSFSPQENVTNVQNVTHHKKDFLLSSEQEHSEKGCSLYPPQFPYQNIIEFVRILLPIFFKMRNSVYKIIRSAKISYPKKTQLLLRYNVTFFLLLFRKYQSMFVLYVFRGTDKYLTMLSNVWNNAKQEKGHDVEVLPKSTKTGDLSQLFTKTGKTIFCNGGQRYDGDLYVLLFGHGEWIFCGPEKKEANERFEFVKNTVS